MNTVRVRVTGVFFIAVAICAAASVAVRAASPDARLVKMLVGKNEAVRLKAIASLQQAPDRARASIEQLVTAARVQADETEADEIVRVSTVEMLYLLGSTKSPESESLLVEMLDAPHAGIAMVAADALGKNHYEDSVEFLKRQINRSEYDSSYGFRFNLVRALAQLHHPDAIEFLDTLSKKLDGQLRFEIDKLLSSVNKGDFDGDEQRFATFQTSRQPKIVLKPAGFESESRQRLNLVPARQYYGIDINAKRMMFIIDHSGSMKDRVGAYSRLDRAKVELIRTISQLPSDSEFAITFYSNSIQQWRDELVEATDVNKRQAIQFIERLDPGGLTNTYGALRQSLLFDSQLEAVFLLTDGKPTCGDIVAPEAIINDIVHRNRFRHLNINTIGIAVDGPMERFLRALAENAAGEFRQAE